MSSRWQKAGRDGHNSMHSSLATSPRRTLLLLREGQSCAGLRTTANIVCRREYKSAHRVTSLLLNSRQRSVDEGDGARFHSGTAGASNKSDYEATRRDCCSGPISFVRSVTELSSPLCPWLPRRETSPTALKASGLRRRGLLTASAHACCSNELWLLLAIR
jgi:hypothetical protein